MQHQVDNRYKIAQRVHHRAVKVDDGPSLKSNDSKQ